jgi:hypothetical protein
VEAVTGTRFVWPGEAALLRALGSVAPVQRYELHLDVKKLGRIGEVGPRISGDRATRGRSIGWNHMHI